MSILIKRAVIPNCANKLIFSALLITLSAFSFTSTAKSWKKIQIGYGGEPVKAVVNGNRIYVAQFNNRLDLHPRTLISSDSAVSWRQIYSMGAHDVCNIAFDNRSHNIYLGKYGAYTASPSSVYKTSDNFQHITPLYHGEDNKEKFVDECPQLQVIKGRLIVTASGRIYYSDNQGQTFKQARLPYDLNYAKDTDITNLELNDNGVIIATTGNGPFAGNYGSVKPKGILFSTDQGETWQQSNAPAQYNYQTQSTVVVNNTFYSLAKTEDSNAIFYSDDGKNWKENKLSLQLKANPLFNYYIPLAVDADNRMYISTQDGVWMKDESGWHLILNQKNVYRVFSIYHGNLLDVEWGGEVKMYSPKTAQWISFAGLPSSVRGPMLATPDAAYIQAVSGLYKLGTDASSWAKLTDKHTNHGIGYTLAYSEDDNSIYAGFNNCWTLQSTDGGATFKQVLSNLLNKCFEDSNIDTVSTTAIAHLNGRTLLGVTNLKSGMFISDDNNNADYVYGIRQWPYQFVKTSGLAIYAAVGYEGVIRSVDGGLTWTDYNASLPAHEQIKHLAFDPKSNLLFAAGSGIYQRNIASDHWQKISLDLPISIKQLMPIINDILVYNGKVYVTLSKFGVYSKPIVPGNRHWTALNDGLMRKNVGQLIQFDNKLYLNDDDDIYEYPLL